MKRLRELRQKKGELVAQSRAILDKAHTEKRSMTAEEETAWNKIDADLEALNKDIEREERQLDREREIASQSPDLEGRGVEPGDRPAGEQADLEKRSLEKAQRPGGRAFLTEQESKALAGLESRAFNAFLSGGIPALGELERRALSASNNTQGGYIVAPQTFVDSLIKAVDDQVVIRQLAHKERVPTAASLGAASLDADPADADWTSELGTGSEDSTMAFGKRELHPHPLAKRIKISNKLMRLNGNAESIARARLAYKFGVSEEKGFLTGDGVQKPLGVFTASNDGIPTSRDISTGSATAITADSLIDAKYSLKAGYQMDPSTRWVFHRDVVKAIRKLKDSQNQYLWQPGLQSGLPDRILDVPFLMSEYAPNTFTTGLYLGIIGAFQYYWIADALDMQIQRLVELYAETNQTGLIGRAEVDGMPVLGEAFARIKTA